MPQIDRTGAPSLPKGSRESFEAQQVPRSYVDNGRGLHLHSGIPTRWPNPELDDRVVLGHPSVLRESSYAESFDGFSEATPEQIAYDDGQSPSWRRQSDLTDASIDWYEGEHPSNRVLAAFPEQQRRHSIARRRVPADHLDGVERHTFTSSAYVRDPILLNHGGSLATRHIPTLPRRSGDSSDQAGPAPGPIANPYRSPPAQQTRMLPSGSYPASPRTDSLPRLDNGSSVRARAASSGFNFTAPAPPQPAASLAPSATADPPRARVACTFCRARKLRCDGAMPCRHCERRAIGCEYAPTKVKPKSKTPPQPSPPLVGSSSRAASSTEGTLDQRDDLQYAQITGFKRKFLDGLSALPNILDERSKLGKRSRMELDFERATSRDTGLSDLQGGFGLRSDAASSSVTGSDLAMLQNDNTAIPLQPSISYPETWFDHATFVIGGSLPFATKLVQLLLRRFVQSNAIFFGLLHAPTLLRNAATLQGIRSSDPALYLSVLAVAACDMHRTQMSEPLTADLRAADAASRKLSMQLVGLARQYIDVALMQRDHFQPSTGQAASILALLYEDGSSEQVALIQVAENIVRSSKVHETVSSREPGVQLCDPDSELYWRRPIASGSSEAEIKYETIVRLCWTGLSHRCRKYIALPDLDVEGDRWPEFLESVRPMAFWEPSILPSELPPSFFHSQNLMRCSAEVARVCIALAGTVSTQQLDAVGKPGSAAPSMIHSLLHRLDDLEPAFVRHQPANTAEAQYVLGRTCQMFCRMHVWARISIWRKHRLWSTSRWSEPTAIGNAAASLTSLPPTVRYWITLVDDMVAGLSKDLDSFVVAGTAPQMSVTEIDSVIRHCITELDLVEASGLPDDFLRSFDRAADVLKRVVSVSRFNPHFPQLDGEMGARVDTAQKRRGLLQYSGNAPRPLVEVVELPPLSRSHSSGSRAGEMASDASSAEPHRSARTSLSMASNINTQILEEEAASMSSSRSDPSSINVMTNL